MKNRNRQFGDARNKNLANSSTNLSMNSNFHVSSYQQKPTNNQSFTSSFIKKEKPLVCVTCVNKKIATEKKINESIIKAKQIQQFNAQLNYKNSQKNLAKEQRQQMLKQASFYNKKMISTHQNMAQSQKYLDSRYISELIQKDQKITQQEKQMIEKKKLNDLKYRKDVYLQYKNQQEKKMQEKLEKLKTQVNQLNLKYVDKSKMIKQYSTELKKQINNNTLRKWTERERQRQQEKQALQQSRKEFLKYTQFMKDDKTTQKNNPEVFQQLKLMDYSRKIMKIQQIQMNNKERQEYLRHQKQLYISETERSLRIKRDYEKDLKQQMTQKSLKLSAEKEYKLKSSWRQQKYTEDNIRVIKPCEQCRHQYDEKCLI